MLNSVRNLRSPSGFLSLLAGFALAVTTLSWAHASEIYRWVDGDGVVNYSQQQPLGVDSEQIGKKKRRRAVGPAPVRAQLAPPSLDSPAPATPSTQRPLADGDLSSEQRKMLDDLKEEEADRRVEMARVRTEQCERSRDLLDKLSNNDRIRLREDDGTERVMPEEERLRRIDTAQRNVAAYCAPA